MKIKLEKIKDIKEFVRRASRYKDLTLHEDNYIVPANSLMGLFALNLDNPLELRYGDNKEDDVREVFKEWVVE